MQRKITTIKLLDIPHNNFVLVSGSGERSKEEVFKILENSIKKNEVKKATKVTHKGVHIKDTGYEEHKYIPALSYQFQVNSRGDKETIRVIAPQGIDKDDEARLDTMCDQIILVKQRAGFKKMIKLAATATLVMISMPVVIKAFEQFEEKSIVQAFEDYKDMQQNIGRENARREDSDMPRINAFGQELPTDVDDLNSLSSIYKENLEDYKMSPELEAITKKYYSNQPLTVDEMETFLDDYYARRDIYMDSVEEFNQLEQKGMNR